MKVRVTFHTVPHTVIHAATVNRWLIRLLTIFHLNLSRIRLVELSAGVFTHSKPHAFNFQARLQNEQSCFLFRINVDRAGGFNSRVEKRVNKNFRIFFLLRLFLAKTYEGCNIYLNRRLLKSSGYRTVRFTLAAWCNFASLVYKTFQRNRKVRYNTCTIKILPDRFRFRFQRRIDEAMMLARFS